MGLNPFCQLWVVVVVLLMYLRKIAITICERHAENTLCLEKHNRIMGARIDTVGLAAVYLETLCYTRNVIHAKTHTHTCIPLIDHHIVHNKIIVGIDQSEGKRRRRRL